MCAQTREKRKKPGIGGHFCIHKYFFERSEIWQNVIAEEGKARQSIALKREMQDEDVDEDSVANNDIQFEPIDRRHLSSLELIRGRLEKLLRNGDGDR